MALRSRSFDMSVPDVWGHFKYPKDVPERPAMRYSVLCFLGVLVLSRIGLVRLTSGRQRYGDLRGGQHSAGDDRDGDRGAGARVGGDPGRPASSVGTSGA